MRRVARLLPLIAVPALVLPFSHGSQAVPTAQYKAYTIGFGNVGEPSIGYDPKHDAALYVGGEVIARLTWDRHGKMHVVDVSPKPFDPGSDPTQAPPTTAARARRASRSRRTTAAPATTSPSTGRAGCSSPTPTAASRPASRCRARAR